MVLGCIFEVFLINLNKLSSFSFPSIMKVPLNILWRQCSEFTWENPKTSESVRGLFRDFDRDYKYSTSSALSDNPSLSF